MASIYLGHFWGYAVNNNHGDYDCYLQYDSVTRSGTTVTMNNARLYMYHDDYGYRYTTNRIAVKAGIGGSSDNVHNNYTVNSYGTHSAGSYTVSLGNPSISTTGTSFSFYVAVASTGGSTGWDNFMTTPLESTQTIGCPAAQSAMGSCTAGSTLSGPTINVTKYESSFTDNITLTYNNKTITRNSFTSSKLSFTEAERLLIFQAQGAGQTKSWSISGNTYSGSTWIGSFSGSVNITTEALSTIKTANNFNVGDNTSIEVNNTCGGTYSITARVSSYSGTTVGSVSNESGTKSITVDMITKADSIYSSNTSNPTGTIYWVIQSFIKGTSIGSVTNKTCTYTFLQSRCGPTLSTFQYAITDAGTKSIMGSTGSDYNYNNNTDLGKFIESKTTLRLKLNGSIQKNATISKYYVSVPGQSDIIASSTSGTVSVNTQVLSSEGTIRGYIEDSRGFSSSLSFSYNLNKYSSPKATFTVERNPMSATSPTQDRFVKLTATVNFAACILASNNGASKVFYRYRQVGGSWSNDLEITSNMTKGSTAYTCTNLQLASDFDQNIQYEFKLVMKDYYHTTAVLSDSFIIPISAPLLSKRYKRLGINKIPTHEGLDVAGDISTDNNLDVSGTVTAGGNSLLTRYTIDASSLDNTKFYPVTFPKNVDYVIDCEIHSPNAEASAEYNQNVIHFQLLSDGWSDLKRHIVVLQYGVHSTSEITIGCVGCGTKGGYTNCVWIRGGLQYKFISNYTPTLHTSDYTVGSGTGIEVFTVGTGYSGGTNTNVEIVFTPGTTLSGNGTYFSGNVKFGSGSIVDLVYPVGSIYLSVNSTNPGTLFGGTWIAWGSGRVPVGVNTSDSNFNTVEKTGGEKTHTLSEAEMPAHSHSGTTDGNGNHAHQVGGDWDVSPGGNYTSVHNAGYPGNSTNPWTSTNGWHDHTFTTNSKGSGNAHNNLQPYITCYMWKRTA